MTVHFTVIGDAMLDVNVSIDADIGSLSDIPSSNTIHVGGSGPNIGAWLAQLGASVTVVASLGDDPGADSIERALQEIGVRCALQRQVDLPTGSCVIVVDVSGERHILSDPGANSRLTLPAPSDIPPGHLHISAHLLRYRNAAAQVVDLLAAYRARGLTISIDLAAEHVVADHSSTLDACLACVDVVFGTAEEIAAGSFPHVPLVVVKSGARGVVVHAGGTRHTQPAPSVAVVDTTGAGDAYAAGFLAAWTAHNSVAQAMELGRRCAATALERVGAWPSSERSAR